jgi:hypothetical protein
MDFRFDAATKKLRDSLLAFMDEKIYPVFAGQMASLSNRWAWTQTPIMGELRAEARARGLWNLFWPGRGPQELAGPGRTEAVRPRISSLTGALGRGDPHSGPFGKRSAYSPAPSAAVAGRRVPTNMLPVVAVTSAKSRRAGPDRRRR